MLFPLFIKLRDIKVAFKHAIDPHDKVKNEEQMKLVYRHIEEHQKRERESRRSVSTLNLYHFV